MDHPSQLSWALAVEPLGAYRGPLSTAGIESAGSATGGASAGVPDAARQRRVGVADGRAGVDSVRELIDRGLRGARARSRARAEPSSREMALATMTEQLPLPENRIVPDFEHRDAIGLPRPRITFRIDDYTRRGLGTRRRIHDEVFTALDERRTSTSAEVQVGRPRDGHVPHGHRPRASVVDPDQRAHDHRTCSSSAAASSRPAAASNPTLTIAALSLRSVRAILRAVKG